MRLIFMFYNVLSSVFNHSGTGLRESNIITRQDLSCKSEAGIIKYDYIKTQYIQQIGLL